MKATQHIKLQVLVLSLLLVACGSSNSGGDLAPSSAAPIADVAPSVPETPILVTMPVAVQPGVQQGLESESEVNTTLPIEIIQTEEQGALVVDIIAGLGEVNSDVTLAIEEEAVIPDSPVSQVETPAIAVIEPLPAIHTPVEVAAPEVTQPALPAPLIAAPAEVLPAPVESVPVPVVEEVEQIAVSGTCSEKKPVYLVLTNSRKAPRAEKVKVKCVKSAFLVRLTIKKKDKPFITLRTEME